MNPVHTRLSVVSFPTGKEAAEAGYNYAIDETGPNKRHPIRVKKVVVVRNGTEEGNATADFILEDADGKQYVFLVTTNLLKMITG